MVSWKKEWNVVLQSHYYGWFLLDLVCLWLPVDFMLWYHFESSLPSVNVTWIGEFYSIIEIATKKSWINVVDMIWTIWTLFHSSCFILHVSNMFVCVKSYQKQFFFLFKFMSVCSHWNVWVFLMVGVFFVCFGVFWGVFLVLFVSLFPKQYCLLDKCLYFSG